MFQTNIKEYDEAFINDVTKALEEGILHNPNILEEDDTEFDMKAEYYPIWACAWNKIDKMDKICKILVKNSKIALVKFKDELATKTNFLERVYRLEDIDRL